MIISAITLTIIVYVFVIGIRGMRKRHAVRRITTVLLVAAALCGCDGTPLQPLVEVRSTSGQSSLTDAEHCHLEKIGGVKGRLLLCAPRGRNGRLRDAIYIPSTELVGE